MNPDDCLFCKIISKDISADVVYEDDLVIAILDINPHTKGHTLIIPKKHYENFLSMPEELMGHFFAKTKSLANTIKNALDASGMNITMNAGADAGQIIFHAHTHVVPRHKDDGVFKPPGRTKYQEGEAKITAEKIRNTQI